MNIQHWPRKREQRNTEQADGRLAAADREVVFGPNDLRAGLEAAGG
jgi:hypothetical protein